MRRAIRKPYNVPARKFVTRLFEMNEYLRLFPPFGENQQLAMDKVLDIAKFAIPLAWQHTMRMHGFVPVLHDENTFIEFCERCKFSERPTHNESDRGQERAANPEHNRRPVNR